MTDLVVGLVALVIGLIVTFAGYAALRVVIALLGAFVGFSLGGALGALMPGLGVMRALAFWVCALLGALVMGWLAYAFYRVGVLLGLGAIGFNLGVALMLALGMRSSWLVWLVGALTAVALVVVGLIGDLPAVLLIVLTALAGANMVISGVMLVFGVVDLPMLQAGDALAKGQSWWWGAAALALAVIGMVAQWQALRRSRSATTMHVQWSGGR
ncbi:MAG TPA: DUF4203 domain-containing protein [Micropruina sp.]|nr:DUF4203 domain-containing protein [Micropruina sp.]